MGSSPFCGVLAVLFIKGQPYFKINGPILGVSRWTAPVSEHYAQETWIQSGHPANLKQAAAAAAAATPAAAAPRPPPAAPRRQRAKPRCPGATCSPTTAASWRCSRRRWRRRRGKRRRREQVEKREPPSKDRHQWKRSPLPWRAL